MSEKKIITGSDTKTEIVQEKPLGVVLDSGSFSSQMVFKLVMVALTVIFGAYAIYSLAYYLRVLIFFLILSILLAYIISPLVNLIRLPFEQRKIGWLMPRAAAITIAFVIVFSALGMVISYIAPRVAEQGREFGASLPVYERSVRQTMNDLNRRFDRLRIPDELQNRVSDQLLTAGQNITVWFGDVFVNTFLFGILLYLPWLIIVPIFSFIMLKDAEIIRDAIVNLFPQGRIRERADKVIDDINFTLAAYTRAQIISCFLIGTVCTIAFYTIGLRYALLLGILAGIFEFVPVIGPFLIGVISTSVAAFGVDPRRAIWVLLFLIVLRIFHDYVSYPRIVRGGIKMHPLLIIISVIAGEQLAGIPGVFLAIPIVAVFTVMYRHVAEYRSQSRFALDEHYSPPVVIGSKE